MRNAASASYSVFSTIPGLSVARKTLIFQCFQKYRYLTSAFERPEFERLILDVKNGKIDCIVVKDLSRFGRNYLETGNYLERIFPFLGVRFIAVADNFDTLTAERTDAGFIVPLKNMMNEAYSRDISRKVSSAYAVKRKKGEFTGTWAAYGYVKCVDDPHRIVPDAETVKIVQDIFRWRLSGMGYAGIARKLSREGILSPCRYHYLKGDAKCERYASSEWNVRTIKRILTNEVYLGHMVQGRKKQSFYEGRGQRELRKSEWTIVRNTHEAIIEEDVFRAVQDMDGERIKEYWEKHGKRPKSPNILKGLVYCADCGKTMTREKHGNGTKVWYSYICRTNRKDPASCSSNSMPESRLFEILWDIVKVQLSLAEDLAGQLRDHCLGTGDICFEDSLKQEYSAAVKVADREENLWLKTCMRFIEEKFLTAELIHALIKRVEIGREKSVAIELCYQDASV